MRTQQWRGRVVSSTRMEMATMARDGGTGATKRGFAAGRAAGNRACWGVLAAALASLAAGGRADEFAGEQPLAV
ncbi:MAG: hypothetical protein EBX36_11900, partial [Planctomycetia bacterium]|nr:hypothetical protein [Planctomycetia bacterium]